MKAALQLLDSLLAESPKGKGRGRNASRISLLGICCAILWNVTQGREETRALDRRVIRIEARLGVTDQGQGAPAASLGTNTTFAAAPLGDLSEQ